VSVADQSLYENGIGMRTKKSQADSGVLANGSSQNWDMSLDEAVDGSDVFLELDGRFAYLVVRLRDSGFIGNALRFLRSNHEQNGAKNGKRTLRQRELRFGRFASTSVSLLWDNEDFPRCFIVIGAKARSTLRLSLDQEDIRTLEGILEQALKALGHGPGS
jgi:hypothetical protein